MLFKNVRVRKHHLGHSPFHIGKSMSGEKMWLLRGCPEAEGRAGQDQDFSPSTLHNKSQGPSIWIMQLIQYIPTSAFPHSPWVSARDKSFLKISFPGVLGAILILELWSGTWEPAFITNVPELFWETDQLVQSQPDWLGEWFLTQSWAWPS